MRFLLILFNANYLVVNYIFIRSNRHKVIYFVGGLLKISLDWRIHHSLLILLKKKGYFVHQKLNEKYFNGINACIVYELIINGSELSNHNF